MNNLLSQSNHRPAVPAYQHPLRRSPLLLLLPVLTVLTGLIIVLALGSGALLLIEDSPLPLLHHLAHAPISAVPLLLIGLASLCFQVVIRPRLLDLFKALMVSSAFILWGVDQLLPAGSVTTTLGDVVIILYVIDLGWMMADRLKQQGWHKPLQQETQPPPVRSANCFHLLPSPPSVSILAPFTNSNLPAQQLEKQPTYHSIPQEGAKPSPIPKRYRLLPLRSVEHMRETDF